MPPPAAAGACRAKVRRKPCGASQRIDRAGVVDNRSGIIAKRLLILAQAEEAFRLSHGAGRFLALALMSQGPLDRG